MSGRPVLVCCCVHAILVLQTAARPAAIGGDSSAAGASGLLRSAWGAASGRAESNVGGGGGGRISPWIYRFRASAPDRELSLSAAAARDVAARTSNDAAESGGGNVVAAAAAAAGRSAAVARSRARRSSGPSAQDLRDTIVPRLRQLEPTMDRTTFLVLWHFISNNVHGSWEDAAARYGGDAQPSADKRGACARSNACLNGGRCYYETEDSKQWRCTCPDEFRGKRCQFGVKSAKEVAGSMRDHSSHSEYANWSVSWTNRD